jgi:hypothetical protein
MSFMLRIDLVLLMSGDFVSDVVNDSFIVDVTFMYSWHVFMCGLRKSGCIYIPSKRIDKGVHFQKDLHICSYLF